METLFLQNKLILQLQFCVLRSVLQKVNSAIHMIAIFLNFVNILGNRENPYSKLSILSQSHFVTMRWIALPTVRTAELSTIYINIPSH